MTTSPAQTDAIAHFEAKLRFETDPSDVHAAIHDEDRFVLIDTRGVDAWNQARIPHAVHMPTATIAASAPEMIALDTPVVVYCWGPGCNGSTKAALQFARLGYSVREMIGGFEYWAREGLGIENDNGSIERAIDELTSPVNSITCDC